MELKNEIRNTIQTIGYNIKPRLSWNTSSESRIPAYKKVQIDMQKFFDTFLKDRNFNILIQSTNKEVESAVNQTVSKVKQKYVKKHSLSG